MLISPFSQLTEDQYSTLNGLLRKSTSSGMRRPLQICLHISPLAVLLDLNLDTQVYSEGAILEVKCIHWNSDQAYASIYLGLDIHRNT